MSIFQTGKLQVDEDVLQEKPTVQTFLPMCR
jgi:hypothetical protein